MGDKILPKSGKNCSGFDNPGPSYHAQQIEDELVGFWCGNWICDGELTKKKKLVFCYFFFFNQVKLPTMSRREFVAHQGEANCVSYSSSGSKLCTGGADMRIKIWDSRSGLLLVILKSFRFVNVLVFSKELWLDKCPAPWAL